MDVNKWYCMKQGEKFGKLAKKKSAIKHRMDYIINSAIGRSNRDILQDILNLTIECQCNAVSIGEVVISGNEDDCKIARIYFVQGYLHGKAN